MESIDIPYKNGIGIKLNSQILKSITQTIMIRLGIKQGVLQDMIN